MNINHQIIHRKQHTSAYIHNLEPSASSRENKKQLELYNKADFSLVHQKTFLRKIPRVQVQVYIYRV